MGRGWDSRLLRYRRIPSGGEAGRCPSQPGPHPHSQGWSGFVTAVTCADPLLPGTFILTIIPCCKC